MTTTAQTFWRQRSIRERWILGGGASLLAVMLLYAYLFLPMQRQRERLATAMPQLRAELIQLRQDAAEVKRLQSQLSTRRSTGLKEVIEADVNSAKLGDTSTQIILLDTTRARVILNNASFASLVAWLNTLQTQEGVRVENIQITAQNTPGSVSADLTLHTSR